MNPTALEVSCMDTSAVSRTSRACFTVRSRSELWQQTADILRLWFNVDLIFQNQGLKLSMLQVKQKEYFVKDPNQLIDSLLLKIFFVKTKQNKKNEKNNKKKLLLSIIKAEILDYLTTQNYRIRPAVSSYSSCVVAVVKEFSPEEKNIWDTAEMDWYENPERRCNLKLFNLNILECRFLRLFRSDMLVLHQWLSATADISSLYHFPLFFFICSYIQEEEKKHRSWQGTDMVTAWVCEWLTNASWPPPNFFSPSL